MRSLALIALAASVVAQMQTVVYNGTTIVLEPSKTSLGSGVPTYDSAGNDLNHLHARKNSNTIQGTRVAGVYVCDGPGFKNNCNWRQVEPYACIPLPTTEYGFGPDPGIQCKVWESIDCTFGGYGGNIVYPGRTNWNMYEAIPDAPSAYQCKFCDKAHQWCGSNGFPSGPW